MATPTVTADIAHPSAKVSRTQSGIFTLYTVVRVFLVTGLDDGSSTAPATALARSLVAFGIPPQGQPAPGDPGRAGCIAISYDTQTIPQDNESVYVLVTYQTPTPSGGVSFVVSDDTVLVRETTELHPSDKTPMTISYVSDAIPAPAINSPVGQAMIFTKADPQASTETLQASFPYSRPLRKVILSGYVFSRVLDRIRGSIGSVNNGKWLGYPKGYWRFDEFRNDGILSGDIVKLTIGMVSRVNENWMQWQLLKSPTLGRRVRVDKKEIQKLVELGYVYTWIIGNGVTATGLHPLANFRSLLGIG
jgi:hypothetical protein